MKALSCAQLLLIPDVGTPWRGDVGCSQAEGMAEAVAVSETNMKNLYWNIRQQLVHHAVTGCVMRAGDLLGTGTISGSTDGSLGSMLELSWRGSREVISRARGPRHAGASKTGAASNGCIKRQKEARVICLLMHGKDACTRELWCMGAIKLSPGPCRVLVRADTRKGADARLSSHL